MPTISVSKAVLNDLAGIAKQFGGIGTGRMMKMNNDLEYEPLCLFGLAAYRDGARTLNEAYKLLDSVDRGETVQLFKHLGLTPCTVDSLARGILRVKGKDRVPFKRFCKFIGVEPA